MRPVSATDPASARRAGRSQLRLYATGLCLIAVAFAAVALGLLGGSIRASLGSRRSSAVSRCSPSVAGSCRFERRDHGLGSSGRLRGGGLRPPRRDGSWRDRPPRDLRVAVRPLGYVDVYKGTRGGLAGVTAAVVFAELSFGSALWGCPRCSGGTRNRGRRACGFRGRDSAKWRLHGLPAPAEAHPDRERSALRAGAPSPRLRVPAVLRLESRSLPRACDRSTSPPRSLSRNSRETTEQLQVANERLERASLSFATALVAALDARDQYTAGHSAVVAVYARDIARRLGLSEEEQHLAHLCGLVHDVGKVGLPAGLLEKPGALTLDERRRMEEHSEIGERILAQGR